MSSSLWRTICFSSFRSHSTSTATASAYRATTTWPLTSTIILQCWSPRCRSNSESPSKALPTTIRCVSEAPSSRKVPSPNNARWSIRHASTWFHRLKTCSAAECRAPNSQVWMSDAVRHACRHPIPASTLSAGPIP